MHKRVLWLSASSPGEHGGPHHQPVRLWEWEDTDEWTVFFITFIVLILFDNLVLHRDEKKLTFNKACLFTCFWLSCAGVFCGYIYAVRGPVAAFDWATGYLLEWMLSVDNLFVFRSIFLVFRTPDNQKHKPLFWGIVGAVIFRMLFFVVGEVLVHSFWWMYILLGVFLIWTGVKVVFGDDEEANPRDSPLYKTIIKYIPYHDYYSSKGRFFDYLTLETERKNFGSGNDSRPQTPGEYYSASGDLTDRKADEAAVCGGCAPGDEVVDGGFWTSENPEPKSRLVATRLMLVVICLEVTDIVFAVDSVSAIVAQIPDLFLAYTACVFAMLGLRATFFVVDELVSLFTFLPYAVGAILVFLGAKLILKQWVHVPPQIVCVILFSFLLMSILLSVIFDRYQGKTGFEACCDAVQDRGSASERSLVDDEETEQSAQEYWGSEGPSWASARLAGSRKETPGSSRRNSGSNLVTVPDERISLQGVQEETVMEEGPQKVQ